MSDHHSMPKTTVTQFLLAVVGALVPVLIVAVLITGHVRHYVVNFGAPNAEKDSAAVAERLKPVAEIATAEAGGAATAGGKSGEEVVKAVCSACHATGALNAPKIGNKGDWGPRISQGYETLIKHALSGIRAMPARGGASDLSDDEVARAVAFMANQGGANFKAPGGK